MHSAGQREPLCLNLWLMLSLSARSATVDQGVTAPSPTTHTKECTAAVFLNLKWRQPQTKGL